MNNYIQDDQFIDLLISGGVTVGNPIMVGSIGGVATVTIAAGETGTICTRGVFDLSVKGIDAVGNSAVAIGDQLFYTTGDTPKINKKASGKFFGYALETVGSSLTDTIKVLRVPYPGPGVNDMLTAGIIDTTMLANDAVTAAKIAAGEVGTTELAALAVTTAKIAAGAVTATELGTDAVTTAKINTGAVTADEIGALAVTTAKIAALAVTAAELAADAVTTVKILDANVTTAKIADANVTADKLATDAVTTAKINALAVTAAELATDAVTTAKILDANVTSAKLEANIALAAPVITEANIVETEATHDYAAGVVDWTLSAAELKKGVISATNASGAVNALATPTSGRFYTVYNTTGQALTFKASGQTGVTIASTKTAIVRGNGTDFLRVTLDA